MSRPVTAIVVNHNGGTLVQRCVGSLLAGSQVPERILVVDTCSSDGSDRALQEAFPEISLLRVDRNRGYAAALNQGIGEACAQGDHLLLLMNNDVILASDALAILARHWSPRAGLVGPKVFRLDGSEGLLDSAWGTILFHHVVCRMAGENEMDSSKFSSVRRVDALLGCILLTSCSVVRQIGPLDPDYFMYLEEVDFAYRIARAGREVLFVPSAHVWHAGGHATGEIARRAVKIFYVRRNSVLFLRKHGNPLHWFVFLSTTLASLVFFLFTLRWRDFCLRVRGYVDGIHAKNTGAKSRSQ